MPKIPTSERVISWLKMALTGSAHGFDLEIPLTPDLIDRRLLEWESAGWILRGAFEPDLSQRVLSIVNPFELATMSAAREIVAGIRSRGQDMYQSGYWWGPGSLAAKVLAQLPAVKEFQVGEIMRYRRGFLRSIGMIGDDASIRWKRPLLARVPWGSRMMLEFEEDPVRCYCDQGNPLVNGEPAFELDCYRCQGTGTMTRKRVPEREIERVTPET